MCSGLHWCGVYDEDGGEGCVQDFIGVVYMMKMEVKGVFRTSLVWGG